MNECRDRKSLGVGAKVLRILLPGAKVPGSEGSRERKFLELSLPGAKVPGNESSKERKFHNSATLPCEMLMSENSVFLSAVAVLLKETRQNSDVLQTTAAFKNETCLLTLLLLTHCINFRCCL